MQSPFLFGKAVSSAGFTNRVKEVKRLKANLNGHINTILISPRRWGKSSLVKKVAADLRSSSVKIVMIDLMRIRNEEEFYKEYAKEIIRATSSKVEEWLQYGSNFLKKIRPKISVGTDPLNDIDISFDWEAAERNYREILNLPEQVAKAKKIKLVICIDEFQNLAHFKEPDLFQRRLRSEWQHHEQVSYCLYGSRQHMMSELFEKQSNAFYKFGDVIYLPKIERQDWVKYITQQFVKTGKYIGEELADQIAETVKDHSYYVQQLSHLVWTHTEEKATKKDLIKATEELLEQNAILYGRDTEQLTDTQLNFLKAVASGIHSGLSAKKTINDYGLGTSGNVLKIKKALIIKELIDDQRKDICFLDPVYELWFKKKIL